jgi:DNA-binding NtrC family response regulator
MCSRGPVPGHLLIVEPEPRSATALATLARGLGYDALIAPDPVAALEQVATGRLDAVLVRIDAVSFDAAQFVADARRAQAETSIVALTPDGDLERAVDAMKRGADHCLTLPARPEAARAVLLRAMQRPQQARAAQAAEEHGGRVDPAQVGEIVGNHPSMQTLLAKVAQAARSRATVLIHGETGTGKELVAAALHQNSRRAGGPFVKVNCAALAESMLESELFGHERGSFTGAAARRKGRFERAAGGTLFLDEVSEIPRSVQVKLLRFLQEREFERVGGDETLRVDVRIVAATNRDLRSMVTDGLFREDLYYRLNVIRLEVPPLRMRPSDITLLAEEFLRRFAASEDKDVRGFDDAAHAQLLTYPWPGNVRELQNAIEQAVVLASGPLVTAQDLPIAPMNERGVDPLSMIIPGVTLAELERYAILKTLESVDGSPARAAEILGISRRTIHYRLNEWGLGRGRA